MLVGLLLLLTAHCSGKTDADVSPSTGDAGDDAQGPPRPGSDASPQGTVCTGRLPVNHRAHASACSAKPIGYTAACTSDADCGGDGGSPIGGLLSASHCLHGQCSTDACFTDSDCPNSDVCSCSPDTRGYGGSSVNSCIHGNCRTDADCATGSYCSPSDADPSGPFYGIQGYYCHTCADLCTDDNECSNACFGTNWCAYDPTVGHWSCGTGCAAG